MTSTPLALRDAAPLVPHPAAPLVPHPAAPLVPHPAALSRTDDAQLTSALAEFVGASPGLLARRELLRRTDTKYLIPASRVAALLGRLTVDYEVLKVPTGSIATYRSLYFDLPNLRCFHDHRRGRRVRHKVRIRDYPDRGLSFLEIKTKRNELETHKHRLALPYGEHRLGPREHDFLREHFGDGAEEFRPQLWIDFRRISLIGRSTNERVTIDVDLTVRDRDGQARTLDERAVVEVKQAPRCARTPVMRALHEAGLRETSMSKYAVAIAATEPGVRRGRLGPVRSRGGRR